MPEPFGDREEIRSHINKLWPLGIRGSAGKGQPERRHRRRSPSTQFRASPAHPGAILAGGGTEEQHMAGKMPTTCLQIWPARSQNQRTPTLAEHKAQRKE